jgi:hypothetical protein
MVLILAAVTGALATSADTTIRQVVRELPALVVVDSARYGFALSIDTVNAHGSLGALARANRHYVLYLTLNAPSTPEAMRGGGTRAAVRERLLRSLSADSAYVDVLVQSVKRHRLAAPRDSAGADRGGSAAAAPRDTSAALPRTVSFQRVLDVAARFFYPDAILPNGRIQSHICVGINGIVDMEQGRDLAVEAFAYASIFHDLLTPRFHVEADFAEASRLINAMDLSTNPSTRLQRAQGVMWGIMVRSEKLRQVLVAEYERARTYLPFRLADAPANAREAAR